MIKAILFDADGVLIHRGEYFSDKLVREHNLSKELQASFFKNEFKDCVIGKKDLKVELPKWLESWGWKQSLDDFLEYWFESENKPNHKMIEIIQELRAKGIKCYMATKQERYRTEFIEKNMGFSQTLDGIFSTAALGINKSDPEFFSEILRQISLDPSEVIFFDDDLENVQTAEMAGIKSYFYSDLVNFKEQIKDLL